MKLDYKAICEANHITNFWIRKEIIHAVENGLTEEQINVMLDFKHDYEAMTKIRFAFENKCEIPAFEKVKR